MVSFGNIIKGDTVIVDRGAIHRLGEMSTDSTNGESDESEPFYGADRESLDVS